jgi:3D (Asp-Asp-Asp) domain-containing protein
MKKLLKILIFLLVLLIALIFALPTSGFIYKSGDVEEANIWGQGFLQAENRLAVAPVLAKISAYCDKGIMASGKETYLGAIACPREIPLKTKVNILDKIYTCEDRTNLKYNGRYDIFMESCESAITWGIKKLSVEIL